MDTSITNRIMNASAGADIVNGVMEQKDEAYTQRVTAKARARVAQALLIECDVPPPVQDTEQISLDRHLSTRYVPNKIPCRSLSFGELLTSKDVEDLSQIFQHYDVFSSVVAPGKSSLNDGLLATVMGRAAADSLPSLNGGASIPAPAATLGSPTTVESPVVGSPSPSAPTIPDKPHYQSALAVEGKLFRDENDFALSREWLVEILLGIISSRLDTNTILSLGGQSIEALLCPGTTSSHSHNAGDIPDDQSSARSSNASAWGGHHQTGFDNALFRARKRAMKLTVLRQLRTELLDWLRPMEQTCDIHQNPIIWEQCEEQHKILHWFHACMLDLESDQQTRPVNPHTNQSLANLLSGDEDRSTEASTAPGSRRTVGAGANSFRHNSSIGLDAGRETPFGGFVPGTELTSVPSPAVAVASTSPGEMVVVPQDDSLAVQLVFFGERADGTAVPTWREVIRNPSEWIRRLQVAQQLTDCPTSPTQAFARGRRGRQDPFHVVCWSDLTNNLLIEGEGSGGGSGIDKTYVRVATMKLEEEDGDRRRNSNRIMAPEREDPAAADDDEEVDVKNMTGSARRRALRSPQDILHDKKNTNLSDMDLFAEELKGLHTQSADHVLLSMTHRLIITASKDGVVKLWEARCGQFVCNLLNIGNSWVLGMYLLHGDQYLLIATSNAELTIVEFPKGTILQKFRGCVSLLTALRSVHQQETYSIQKYGLKPGECGPHYTSYKDGMPAEVFHTLRREARLTHYETAYPAKPMEGFVLPTTFAFDHQLGFCFFGSADGAIGCFNISHEVKWSTILSGSNTKPMAMNSAQQAHPAGVRVTGIFFSHMGHCVISSGQDGTLSRTPLLRDVHTGQLSLGAPGTVVLPSRPIRLMVFCPDAKLFATAHSDRRVLLWSVGRSTTELVHQFPQETQDIISIAFIHSEQRIALLSADRSIRIYDYRGYRPSSIILPSRQTGNRVEDLASVTLTLSMDDDDGCLAFCPTGERLVCALRSPIMYEPVKPVDEDEAKLSKEAAHHIVPLSVEDLLSESSSESSEEEEESSISTTSSILADFSAAEAGSASGPIPTKEEVKARRRQERQQMRAEQKQRDKLSRASRRLAALRQKPHTTHTKGVVQLVVNRTKMELYTFSADKWKVWDLQSGDLRKEVDLPHRVSQALPMFHRTMIATCGWTTDLGTRLIAGARNGVAVTLDPETYAVVHAEDVLHETRNKMDMLDMDVSVVLHHGQRTFLCGGRTCVARRYAPGAVHPNGAEDHTEIIVRLPTHVTTITACCVIRDTHVCLGTADTKLYFFRLIDGSLPYAEEVLRDPDGDPEIGAVVGLFFLNDHNQNLIVVILDTGVLHVYSYLKNITLARLRLLRPHECVLRRAIHIRGNNTIVCGDSHGRVRVLNVSTFTSEQTDFKKALTMPYFFQGATHEIVSLEYVDFPTLASTARVFSPESCASTHSVASPNAAAGSSVEDGSAGSPLTSYRSRHPTTLGNGLCRYLVVGSLDGNVRLFYLDINSGPSLNGTIAVAMASSSTFAGGAYGPGASITTPCIHRPGSDGSFSDMGPVTAFGPPPLTNSSFNHGRVSTPGGNATATVVGLFGVDRWVLADRSTYTEATPAFPANAAKQNELFLDNLLHQAKKSIHATTNGFADTFGVKSSTTNNTQSRARNAINAMIDDGETHSVAQSSNVNGPAHYGDGGISNSVSRKHTVAASAESPMIAAVAPNAAKGEDGLARAGDTLLSCPFSPIHGGTNNSLPSPLSMPPHSIEGLIPFETVPKQLTSINIDHDNTFVSTFQGTITSAGESRGTQGAFTNSLGPQRQRKESKFRRNTLLRLYPVSWLKKIGVLHALSPVPEWRDTGSPVVLEGDVAFGKGIHDLLLPIADDDDDDDDGPTQPAEPTLPSDSLMDGEMDDLGYAKHGRDTDSHATREEGHGTTVFLTGVAAHSSYTAMPSLDRDDACVPIIPHSTTVSPIHEGTTRAQSSSGSELPRRSLLSNDTRTHAGFAQARGFASDATDKRPPSEDSKEGGGGGGPSFPRRRDRPSRCTLARQSPPQDSGAGSTHARRVTASSVVRSIREEDGITPPLNYADLREERPPTRPPAGTRGAVSMEGVPNPATLRSTSETSREVLEERRDQLMLAHLASQLDRVQPAGYEEGSFMKRIRGVWLRRSGDAAVEAATRAAALSNASTPAPAPPSSNGSGAGGNFSPGGRGAIMSAPDASLPALLAERQHDGRDRGIGLDLHLLNLPTETPSTKSAASGSGLVLSAQERLLAQLRAMRVGRQKEAAERHHLEERNPNPRNQRFWLPQISARQAIQPIRIVLPTTLREDETAKAQLRQLQLVCNGPNPTFGANDGGKTEQGGRRGRS